MKIGLIGSPYSRNLCLLKARIEDSGHKASFIDLRKFPQYTIGTCSHSSIEFDHDDLMDFDAFYLDYLEQRERFFRGRFDKKVWAALRERYTSFSQHEVENLAFQISLLMTIGAARPVINPITPLMANRLRPVVLSKLRAEGLSVASFLSKPDLQNGTLRRIRIEEEECYDVPCFPRDLSRSTGIQIQASSPAFVLICTRGGSSNTMIVRNQDETHTKPTTTTLKRLCRSALELLSLEVAQFEVAPDHAGYTIIDVNPFTPIAKFEDQTGEQVSALIANRLIELGGKN